MNVRQLYNQVPEAVGVSWRQDAELRASGRQRALGPQWPTVEQPHSRWERSAAIVRRTLGQYSSLSPSPAHLSHTTSINPFENKVWEIYFYKEVCLFVHWSSSLCLIMFRIYLYMYVAIQHLDQRGHRNNGNEEVTSYPLEIQNWSLNVTYNLVLISGYPWEVSGVDSVSIFQVLPPGQQFHETIWIMA